jgi:hypothetical protein
MNTSTAANPAHGTTARPTADTTVLPTTATRPTRRGIGAMIRRAAFVAAAIAALVMGTAPLASADSTWLDGQITSSGTVCDYNSRLIQVSASASQMSNFPNGQYVRYRIWTQDVASGQTFLSASWSAWQWIDGRVGMSGVGVEGAWVIQAKPLGTTNLYGVPGHGYRVVVEYDWWTGHEATGYDPDMIYTEGYAGWNQTYTNCWF